jgi:hypothetical protein
MTVVNNWREENERATDGYVLLRAGDGWRRAQGLRTPLSVAFLLFTLSGCVRRVPLQYELPPTRREPTGVIAAYVNVADLRGDKSLDEILGPPPLFSVNNIVSGEMEASGTFEKVIVILSTPASPKAELSARNVTHLFESFLFRLDFVVPDHASPKQEAFMMALITGTIGAAIWANIPVDAYGYATLMVRVTDLESGHLTAKIYEGTAKRRVSLGECDEPETISWLAGLALKDLMTSFRADLNALRLDSQPTSARTPSL